MTEDVKISKVEIKVGKHVFELTLEQAKSLKGILNDTFPDKETQFIPQPYLVYPYCPSPSPWHGWEITWGSGTADNIPDDSHTLCLSVG